MVNYKALIYIKLDIVRIGVETIFNRGFEQCLHIVAHSDDEFERYLQQFSYNLIILQFNQNSIDDIFLLKKLKDNYMGTKVLIFNSNRYRDFYRKKWVNTANAIFNEETTSFELIQIIHVLLKSSDYFSNEVVLKNRARNTPGNEDENFKNVEFKRLSTREYEVATLLVKGHSNNDICNLLNLSASSISTFKTRILKKTNTKNVIELLQLYQTELRLY
ncbi:response regulator transcription factor [Flavobacterium sp.]|uniref:helix-turn-helix transcriptional regulator n=1 Tax=Flavobacterium sp. TaxID=239 RepID=UPI0026208FAB|nr:response regulator transcription factor [Flavobacterium sp.]